MQKNARKFFVLLILTLIIIGLFLSNFDNFRKAETITTTCPECRIEDPIVVLNTFPVDIDELFWVDNSTKQKEILNYIGNGSVDWPITPWGAHYISSHYEGVDHWYINSYQLPHIVSPHDGVAIAERCDLGSTILMQNGSEVIEDCFLVIDIGDNCYVYYGHLNLFKTIYDEIILHGSYTFTEGEQIGYSRDSIWGGFDFYYEVNGRVICPIHSFNPSLQAKIINYYDLLIPKAKIAGTFPEIEICNNISIAVENSIWGIWNYSSGYLDSYHYSSQWYEGKMLTFFNRSFANPSTFYRDWKDRWNLNITDDILGIFSDIRGDDIPEYNTSDICYIKAVDGDFSNGIIEIIFNSYDGEWGDMNDSIFILYDVEYNDVGFKDDTLRVEFFPKLIDAQTGFTNKNLTYVRHFHWWNQERVVKYNEDVGFPFILPFTLGMMFIVISYGQKKKNK